MTVPLLFHDFQMVQKKEKPVCKNRQAFIVKTYDLS